jgi:hypothetical protein
MLVRVLEIPRKTEHEDEADIQDNNNRIKMHPGTTGCPCPVTTIAVEAGLTLGPTDQVLKNLTDFPPLYFPA